MFYDKYHNILFSILVLIGIDIGKRKYKAAIKNEKGTGVLDEFFFGNDGDGVHNLLSRMRSHGKCSTRVILESTGNMWIIHDTLEDNGIDAVLANPYKTRIIAIEAKIKSVNLMLEYYLIYCSNQI